MNKIFSDGDCQLLRIFLHIERCAVLTYQNLTSDLVPPPLRLGSDGQLILSSHQTRIRTLDGLLRSCGQEIDHPPGEAPDGLYVFNPTWLADEEQLYLGLREISRTESRHLSLLESLHAHLGQQARSVIHARILSEQRRTENIAQSMVRIRTAA